MGIPSRTPRYGMGGSGYGESGGRGMKDCLIFIISSLSLWLLSLFASHHAYSINPFAPEPLVTASADPRPLYCLWRHRFLMVTFKPQNLEILLSTHASQASISVEQKVAKCTTCKRPCAKFYRLARQWPENRSTSFKTRFLVKFSGVNGLSKVPSFFEKTHFSV